MSAAAPAPAPIPHAAVRVLVIDDEPITASAHADYLRRIDGFEVAGIAHDGREAIRLLRDSIEPTMVPDAAGPAPATPTPSTPAQPSPAPPVSAAPAAPPVPAAADAALGHTIGSPGSASIPVAPTSSIHLILLDMNLPDTHGLDLCRRIRASGLVVDVIAITAVRDVAVVRSAVSLGIVQYLIKPFTYPTFAEKMRSYLAFRSSFDESQGLTTQSDVDHTMAALRPASRPQLDKGLSQETLDNVIAALRAGSTGLSAAELADARQMSRVTARRYLEHLVELGTAVREPRYGAPGRPELEYRWRDGT